MRNARFLLPTIVVVAVLAALPAPGRADEWRLTIDPERSEVRITLAATLHTVRGTFQVERGDLTLEPDSGCLAGEVVVDATSGGTGNRRRDRDMHSDVLDSDRHPAIVLRPRRLEGELAPSGRSEVRVHGELVLLGESHPVVLPLVVELTGSRFAAAGELEIPYVEWGLTDPSTWLLRVAKTVDIAVVAEGRLER